MTRIESSESETVKNLEKEVASLKKKVKKSERKKFNKLWSALIGLAVIIGVVLYLLARTGFSNIPLLTPLVYTEPEPSYWLDPLTIPDADLQKIAQQQVEGALFSVLRGEQKTIPVSFTEEELTGAIRNDQLKNRDAVDPQFTQVILHDGVMEFFTIVKNEKRRLSISLVVQPQLSEGEVDVEVLSFKIGAAHIPRGIGQLLINTTVEPVLDTSIAFAKDVGRIGGITIGEGELTINLELAK